MASILIGVFIVICLATAAGFVGYWLYRKALREAKNYERGLKMVSLRIHLPPVSDDIESNSRDERDVADETISQAQVMYNIISSTATKGFKSKIYGQRHIAFEIAAVRGFIEYYIAVPVVLVDVIKQAVAAAYPSAYLEEVEERNIFNQAGKISGTIGGELTLRKDYSYPIATFKETKRDPMRAILNALSSANKEDGAAVQILLRPAPDDWSKKIIKTAEKIKKDKGKDSSINAKGLLEALWKPPETGDSKPEEKQLSSLEQSTVEAMEEKTQYPGYEALIRLVASSNTAGRSQAMLQNIVSSFKLFDSPNNNGFQFTVARDIEQFVTSFIFRFFPQEITSNILNSVELSTIFHIPDQKNTPTSQLQRQASKQVDGPQQSLDEGLLLGYNVFRGIKKQIRLGVKDRRRHTYIIGQTGTGKSVLMSNLAIQDILDGKGFAYVDPHGDEVLKLLGMIPKERAEDVIYFSPGDMDHPIGLNMFEFDHPDQKDFLVQEAVNMLYGLYDPGHTGIVGPRLEHIFRNCALLLMADPKGGTFIDIPKLLVDNSFVQEKLKYVTDQNVLDFWTKEWPASQRSSESGEVVSWVVSKFGPFQSNAMMRNIIGQTKSGFNIREIMDNKKILLVNLSKGKTGEYNSRLLGMIFIMKFQAAAMGRADMNEEDREDFCLYVDEFQNFATESFETILSEARKYRLNLILGNQFISQLTEKIREAIIGNVGTVISGRIGQTDADFLVKKFNPPFDEQDLTNLPNHESVAVVQIAGVPSAPFSMSWVPPMGHISKQLEGAMRRLSAAKYGKPRSVVEKEIFARIKTEPKKGLAPSQPNRSFAGAKKTSPASGGSSFLDEWLEKRKKLNVAKKPSASPTKLKQSLADSNGTSDEKKVNNIGNSPDKTLGKSDASIDGRQDKDTLSIQRPNEDHHDGEVEIKL